MDKSNFSESSSDPETDSEENEDEEDDSDDDDMLFANPKHIITATNYNMKKNTKTNIAPTRKEKIIPNKISSTPTKVEDNWQNKQFRTAGERKAFQRQEIDMKKLEIAETPKFKKEDASIADVKSEKSIVNKKNNSKALMNGRGVTTQLLIEEEILKPGEKCLTINYLGRNFVGDLNQDGTIKCHNANQVFSSPSAWAMNCKKQVNPDKKSGCGWASVKYRGRKLDEFKTNWCRKLKLANAVEKSEEENIKIEETAEESRIETNQKDFNYYPDTTDREKETNNDRPFSSHQPCSIYGLAKGTRRQTSKRETSVKHCILHRDSDPSTLVECAQFQSTGRMQPFSVSISTSALLIMDFHSHLSTCEVTGYLCGIWDSSRQHIRISQVFPCCYPKEATQEEIENIEMKIQDSMEEHSLTLLGWYHSHPFVQPDPTINDISAQVQYQEMLKDGVYEPCVGLIVSPYGSWRNEAQFNAYWVNKPTQDGEYGLPLSVRFTTFLDQVLTQNIIDTLVYLVNFYCHSKDVIKFNERWNEGTTYLDKLKNSLSGKLPQDQTDGKLLDFIHKMLMAACT